MKLFLLFLALLSVSTQCITLSKLANHIAHPLHEMAARMTYLDPTNDTDATQTLLASLQTRIEQLDVTEHKLVVAVIILAAIGLSTALMLFAAGLCLLCTYQQRRVGRSIANDADFSIEATYNQGTCACQRPDDVCGACSSSLYPVSRLNQEIENKI